MVTVTSHAFLSNDGVPKASTQTLFRELGINVFVWVPLFERQRSRRLISFRAGSSTLLAEGVQVTSSLPGFFLLLSEAGWESLSKAITRRATGSKQLVCLNFLKLLGSQSAKARCNQISSPISIPSSLSNFLSATRSFCYSQTKGAIVSPWL
jgi:hypothetical protein